MRILHALHDYLPDQVAGIEVYTNRVAHEQARAHDVGILFARMDPSRPTGFVESSREGAVSLYGLVQNRRWLRFAQDLARPGDPPRDRLGARRLRAGRRTRAAPDEPRTGPAGVRPASRGSRW